MDARHQSSTEFLMVNLIDPHGNLMSLSHSASSRIVCFEKIIQIGREEGNHRGGLMGTEEHHQRNVTRKC